jgi:hypothetical protein
MNIAVVSSLGMGDGLILQVAAFQLRAQGYEVTTFNDHLASFGPWFGETRFAPQPRLDETFDSFDAIFLQHDNTPKSKQIHALPLPVYTFYGSHQPAKHGPLRDGLDYVCDPNRTMVDNVREAVTMLFGASPISSENGLKPPPGLIHRKNGKRVIIHPTSTKEEKNWPQEKFLKVAHWLTHQGYEPVFIAPSSGQELWPSPPLPDLASLGSLIYESGFFLGNDSGPGHLASYLQIPHLIIAQDAKLMRLWRPGWMPGTILTPPRWFPNWKKLRKYWKKSITTKRVIKNLKNNVLNN